MGKFLRFVLFLHLTFFFAVLMACTGVQFPEQPDWKEVPITDIQSIAGVWEGVTWSEPRTARQDDFVKVKIAEDGQFEFASYRMIGVWLGKGNLILENGKLVTESNPNAGSATFTLYEGNGRRMLKVQGKTKTGLRQAAELTTGKK